MRTPLLIASAFLFSIVTMAQPSHDTWDGLLQAHVSNGKVDYKGMKKDVDKLNSYLSTLQKNDPSSSWSADDRLAYWINLYNATMVKQVVENYPIKSPKDIKINGQTVWKAKTAKVGDKTYSLDHVENGIIRKEFKDPRIHFAVNCAAVSCPPLHNRAFKGSTLDRTLDMLTKNFINGPMNDISKGKAEVSKIFEWYQSDFTDEAGSILGYISRYSNTDVGLFTKIVFKNYNWSLND